MATEMLPRDFSVVYVRDSCICEFLKRLLMSLATALTLSQGLSEGLYSHTFGVATLVQERRVTTISTTIKWMPSPPLLPETTSCNSGPSQCRA